MSVFLRPPSARALVPTVLFALLALGGCGGGSDAPVAPPPAPPTAQTITFTTPGTQTLGTTPAPLVASASSGLAVSLASTSPAVCTVSGTALTLVQAGTCTLTADQAGNAQHAAAPQQTVSFMVAACTPPTAAAGLLIGFDDSTRPVTVAGFNGDAGSVAPDPAGGCNRVGAVTRSPGSQYDGATFGTGAPADSPTIPALAFTGVGDVLTLRVWVPAAPTLVHLKIENAANGAQNYETEAVATQANAWQTLSFPLNAPLVGGLPGQAFNLSTVYDRVSVFFGFGAVQGAAAATFYFDDLVLTAGPAAPRAQTISFASPGNQTLGTAPPALVATASSGLVVSIASQTPAVCTVGGTTLTLVATGTCTLTADQAGNAGFDAAVQQQVSFTVVAAGSGDPNALVSFDAPGLGYVVAAFNGATGQVAIDPDNAANHVGSVTRTPGSQYDGATFGHLAPADSPTIPRIAFTSASNRLTLRVWVPAATLVHLKIENAANGAINYETELQATQAGAWQTLSFPLNAPLVGGLPGQAFNLASVYDRVSVFFGFGAVQGAAATTYYFDDLVLVP